MMPFDNSYAQLPEHFYARLHPAQVPHPQFIHVNESLAEELGIDPKWLNSAEGLSVFSGNSLAAGSAPIAQAYAGHQFGGFVPQLGDGRALLLGEVIDAHGQRRDIQLKGSGRTPFSRGGDGKAALGPILREYLLSESMHALGIPTTRALAAVTTGEKVMRESPLDGAIITRIASSHLRIGTFEYFAAREDYDALNILTDYALHRHYPDHAESENPALALLKNVITAQATLIPQWMGIGFIHGVMNTDNMTISGETIDYGPCAFMDTFHPDCVFSAIDRGSRYAWGNQPVIGHWNLTRLAEALLPVIDPDPEKAKELAEKVLEVYPQTFTKKYDAVFRQKFGLVDDAPFDIVKSILGLLAKHTIDYTLFFRHLTTENIGALRTLFPTADMLENWLPQWRQHLAPDAQDKMRATNPILIPRNHRIEQAIQAGYNGDFSLFRRLLKACQHPYTENSENTDLEAPPKPEEVVRQTFCGT